MKLSFFGSIENFMSVLSEQIFKSKLAKRVFSERQIDELIDGTAASRYALVNRALKDGSIIRVKRGEYILNPKDYKTEIHPFVISQAILPGSYISFETALVYHGWIPEAVYSIASVTPGRKTIVTENKEIGHFSFHPIATNEYQFLKCVERKQFNNLTAFVAKPLRALIDLVALRKETWQGLDWVVRGMRIDESQLLSLKRKDFSDLKSVYKHKAVNVFLSELELAALKLKSKNDDGGINA